MYSYIIPFFKEFGKAKIGKKHGIIHVSPHNLLYHFTGEEPCGCQYCNIFAISIQDGFPRQY